MITDIARRLEVEDFLYHEAALLDDWRLDEWLELFTPDARYTVPATDDPLGSATDSLVLIEDDHDRIRGRVERLKSRRAHREFPSSRTRRFITNVRILSVDGDELVVTSNFAVHRIRGSVDVFIGRYVHTLVAADGSFKIRRRRAELDLEALRPHGTVSIVL